MLEIIKSDLYRIHGKPFHLVSLLKGFRSQGFRYLFFRRLRDHFALGHPVGFLSRLFLRRYTYKFGFQIGGNIGAGFYIGHFGTIVVSTRSVIGKNCNIAHLVTVGVSRGRNEGAPVIGDEVWIGTGAVIVGNIQVGSHVLIAPNAFVNFDVPDHSLVIGNPGRIIAKHNPTKDYINYKWEF